MSSDGNGSSQRIPTLSCRCLLLRRAALTARAGPAGTAGISQLGPLLLRAAVYKR
jgi:hypothetical protein